MSDKKRLLIFAGILFSILLIAYANHFDNTFHFDDSHTIQGNMAIRSLKNIPSFFYDPTTFSVSQNHRGLRPLVTTSLAIDYWLAGGLDPVAFQISTFLWHIGLCILLFFMFRQLMSKSFQHKWIQYVALFGAAWFGTHTVNAETINYIISRSDVLSTFFIAASFLTYVAYPEKRKFGIYILLALVGVLAKETIPVLPILLFFYLLLFEHQLSLTDIFKKSSLKKVFRSIYILLPLAIAIAALQWFFISKISDSSASAGISNPLGYYLLTQTYVWAHYFRSYFAPYDLSADSDLGVINDIYDPRIIVGTIFLLALVYTIFRTSKTRETRPIAFGLIWFAASLLPTSLVPFAEVMNDHRMYFAFVGLTLSIVTLLGLLAVKYQKYFEKPGRQKLLLGLAFLIIGLNAFGTFKRNQVWDNEESLWKDVTEKSPNNGRGWMNYGLALMARGDFKGSIEAYTEAQKTSPNYSTLFINFGIAYSKLGENEHAVESFNRAVSLAPGNFESYIYFARNYTEAKRLAEQAMSLNSTAYMARDIAMDTYQHLGLWTELENLANSTLAIVPNDSKSLQYLNAAKNKKVMVISQDTFAAVSVQDGLLNESLRLYNEGRFEECIKTCEKVLEIDPKSANAYNNICASYNMLKQWDKAKEACTKALQLNPVHPNAPANLKWAMSQNPD